MPDPLPAIIEFVTPRLRLRQWRQSDREPLAALNADPAVMEFFPATLDRAASDQAIDNWRAQIAERGWGLWAVEIRDAIPFEAGQFISGEFIGFVGLTIPRHALPFAPCVEVGWRLAKRFWGNGFATEAARGCLEVGFGTLGLAEIVSYTALTNCRSWAVMERLGMRNMRQDFAHPGVPENHPLQPHCLYCITRDEWLVQRAVGKVTS